MIDKRMVEYVANLSRIALNDSDKAHLAQDLSKIIDYIDKLKELNLEGIEPTRGVLTEKNVLRADKITLSNYSQDILKNAPVQENNQFKVPKII